MNRKPLNSDSKLNYCESLRKLIALISTSVQPIHMTAIMPVQIQKVPLNVFAVLVSVNTRPSFY